MSGIIKVVIITRGLIASSAFQMFSPSTGRKWRNLEKKPQTVSHDLNGICLRAKANKALLSLGLAFMPLACSSVKSKASQYNSSVSGTLALH